MRAHIERAATERRTAYWKTPPTQCTSRDFLRLRTTDTDTMRHLVKYSLRCTPDRIVIGEVRDGAAKELLDAWITGHPGGCGTVHGEVSRRALEWLSELARETAVFAGRSLFSRSLRSQGLLRTSARCSVTSIRVWRR